MGGTPPLTQMLIDWSMGKAAACLALAHCARAHRTAKRGRDAVPVIMRLSARRGSRFSASQG